MSRPARRLDRQASCLPGVTAGGAVRARSVVYGEPGGRPVASSGLAVVGTQAWWHFTCWATSAAASAP